jgi:integrase
VAYPEKRGKTWRVRWQLPEIDPKTGRHKEGSESGFTTRKAALDYGEDQEAAIRAGTWINPDRGKLTLGEWWERWIKAQDLAERSRDFYESTWRNHVGPTFGARELGSIMGVEVDAWYAELLERRALRTAAGARKLLKLLCDDAAADRLIQASPVRAATRRRGRIAAASAKPPRTGVVVDLETVQQLRQRLIAADYLMILVAAFTGMRWGELIGMRRQFLHLTPATDDEEASGFYVIDPLVGAVHEDKRGRRTYGPPKGYKGRTVELPPFLVELLLAHLKRMPRRGSIPHDPSKSTQADADLLFPNRAGAPWARNNWHPIWRRACDGYEARAGRQGQSALLEAPAVCEGLVVHDLRHTHKTWLAEDGIPPVARDERLGHSPDRRDAERGGMDEVYLHATPKMRARLLEVLQARWESAQNP